MSGRPDPQSDADPLGELRPESKRSEALAVLRLAFQREGIGSPALDARVLLTAALGLDATAFLTDADAPLGPGPRRLALDFARRRLAREPVARILGVREFWGLPFALSPDTLVPRPETETVVETALRLSGGSGDARRVLDLGTGSGCLLVSLLRELPGAVGLGLDLSPGALATARANAARHGVADRALFAAGDWATAAAGPFDLIVANPPYVASSVVAGLAPEVAAWDPPLALDGGADGLAAYRGLLPQLAPLLDVSGSAVLEIGYDQEAAARELATSAGLDVREVVPDLAGHPRAVALHRRDSHCSA